MDDLITIPRESLETFLSVAGDILARTEPTAPDNLERAEVTLRNNNRKQLVEAVYQAEKAIFANDVGSLDAEQMSQRAKRKHDLEDICLEGFSDDKMNHIEGRR